MHILNPQTLDTIRKEHRISSDEKLAAKIGVTVRTIHNLRHGHTSPSLDTLVKLSALAGKPIENMIVERKESKAAA